MDSLQQSPPVFDNLISALLYPRDGFARAFKEQKVHLSRLTILSGEVPQKRTLPYSWPVTLSHHRIDLNIGPTDATCIASSSRPSSRRHSDGVLLASVFQHSGMCLTHSERIQAMSTRSVCSAWSFGDSNDFEVFVHVSDLVD